MIVTGTSLPYRCRERRLPSLACLARSVQVLGRKGRRAYVRSPHVALRSGQGPAYDGRLRSPDEIAGAALFLPSDESSFVNGSESFADGKSAQI